MIFEWLPDFFIPIWNTWIEIKPKEPTSEEWRRCEELLISLLKKDETASVAILYGRPWLDERGPEYRYVSLEPMIGGHQESDDSEEGIYVTAENLTAEYIDSDERIFTECRRCQQIKLDSLGMHYREGLIVDNDKPDVETPAIASELQRLRQLEKEHAILKEEHELLKKAIRFCSERKPKSSRSSSRTGKNTKSK